MLDIKRLSKSFFSAIVNYKFTILAVIYYSLIAIYPSITGIRPILVLGPLSIIFIHNIIAKTRFTMVWGTLLSIIISFNAYIAFVYDSYIPVGLLASVMETSMTEASSMLSGVIPRALLVFAITTFLIYMSTRELRAWKFSRIKSLLVVVGYCYFLLPIAYRRVLITELRDSYSSNPVLVMQRTISYYSPLLYGNVMTVAAYINEMRTFWEFSKLERVTPNGITLDTEKKKVKKVFVVVGESATRSRMSLYGYNKPTTPFADSLHQANPDKLHFYNGTASASFTRNAVPSIVSTSHARGQDLFYKEKTLIDLAKENGYETMWLSNQARLDLWSSLGNYIGNVASSANHNFFSRDDRPLDDPQLLDYVKLYYSDDDKPQLFVIHLLGSHYQYFGKFDNQDVHAMPGEYTDSNMYDWTLHYTDRMLRTLYNDYVKNDDNAMILYVSDHGEDVGTAFGHAIIPISRIQFEVPFMIFNNSSFPADSIAKKYIGDDNLLNNSNAMFILSEAIGYTISEGRREQALDDGKYTRHGDDDLYKISTIEPFSLTDQNVPLN